MTRIEFSNVGRKKLSWSVEVPSEINWDQLPDLMWSECKTRGALLSNSLGFTNPDAGGHGKILAGFRTVGDYRIVGTSAWPEPLGRAE